MINNNINQQNDYQSKLNAFYDNEDKNQLEQLRQKYSTVPNYKNMSLRDELQTRFDLNQMNDLEKRVGTNLNTNIIAYDVSKSNGIFTFDDIYYSKKNSLGDIIYRGTDLNEGGYSNRKNDLGGATNYGITQSSLNEYNLWKSSLKKGRNFPMTVEQLTPMQSKQILDEMYFQRYAINRIKNLDIAKNVFDAEMNQGTEAGKWLVSSVNEYCGKKHPINVVVSQSLANDINALAAKDISKINDLYVDKRMNSYFNSVDRIPEHNINNILGWYNRLQRYHSDPKVFEQRYKNKVDDYRFNKYPQYYTGK